MAKYSNSKEREEGKVSINPSSDEITFPNAKTGLEIAGPDKVNDSNDILDPKLAMREKADDLETSTNVFNVDPKKLSHTDSALASYYLKFRQRKLKKAA